MAASLLAGCGGGSGSDSGSPDPVTYPVSVTVSGNGKLSSVSGIDCGTTCTTNIPPNTSITLTATPDAGHSVQAWGGACATASGNSCTVTVSKATSLSVSFAVTTYPLEVSITGSGRIASQPAGIDCSNTCTASFASQTSVVLTATPSQGQVLQAWGGACTGASGNSCTVLASQARSVTATFAAQSAKATLRVAVTGAGTVSSQPAGLSCGGGSSSCEASFPTSTVVTLKATPSAGQTFQSWGGVCSGSTTLCTVTMDAAREVTASFVSASGPALAWGSAVLLEPSNDYNVTDTGTVNQVNAISPNGDAMVIWQQPDGQSGSGKSNVFSRMYIAGQGWLPIVQVPGLSDFSNRELVSGRLFIDAQRVATWIRPGLDTRRFSPPNNWSGPTTPPNKPATAGQLSSALIDDAGNIALVTAGSDVYHIRLSSNDQWSTWTRIDASGALDVDTADIARSADGSAMAIWVERNPGDGNDSLKAARFDPVAGWQTPVEIDRSFDDVDQGSPPRVAMDAAGNAMAVWRQSNAIQIATFSPTAGWSAPTAHDKGALESQPLRLRLVMAANGRAVAAWQSGGFAIKSVSYTPGSGFASPIVAAPYALDRELGFDEQGDVVLVYVGVDQWPNPTSPELSVYTRKMPWGQAWGPQALLETQVGGIKGGLAVSFGRSGSAIASWAQNDAVSGPRNSLWANLRR